MSGPEGLTRRAALGLAALAPLGATAACSASSGPGRSRSADAADPNVLRVLGGSELQDLEPLLAEAAEATGVRVAMTFAGSLEGAELVAGGGADRTYDGIWFSSDRYLSLLPGGAQRVLVSTKIMTSPVVLGVRPDAAARLGWDRTPPTWADVATAASARRLTYGMTNPASSNSGFSALVAVATALAGGGAALDPARAKAVAPRLTAFFRGQVMTSGSSGWLADRFVGRPTGPGSADALINYESVLLTLNAARRLPRPLTVVRPRDGVVTADYPFGLLASARAKRPAYDRLVGWLRSSATQRQVMSRTARRPGVPGVRPDTRFGSQVLIELPFPAQRAVVDGLIDSYLSVFRRPSRTIYVLDVSGSMEGERLAELKRAMSALASPDRNGVASFSRFRAREVVTMLPFSSAPQPPRSFTVPSQSPETVLAGIRSAVADLDAGGETMIFGSLSEAYRLAAQQVAAGPDDFVSVVLMTDGENTTGPGVDDFGAALQRLDPRTRAVPTYCVLFGDSVPRELQQVAGRTGGKVFDARTSPLTTVFREIRGYQ